MDEALLKSRLSSYYETESTKLGSQIASYYTRYGADNIIEYRTMLETLDSVDTKLLYEQMNTFAVRYPEYAHLLPVRESIYSLNRLEGLQQSIMMQQLEIGAITNAEIQAHLEKQALLGANSSMELLGFGKNFYSADSNVVKNFVNTAWVGGNNFSSRIWANSDKLANYLATDVAQGFARGDNYNKLVTGIMQRFENVNRNDAYRLIYTEGTYVMAESTIRPFEDDFEQYKISTVGDGKVCDICSSVAESVFNITDRQPGVNFPPFHAWCRCSFAIHVEDWKKWQEEYEKKHTNSAENLAEKVGYDRIESIRNLPIDMPVGKFVNYALHPTKSQGKAAGFKSALGYDINNYEELYEQIQDNYSVDKLTYKYSDEYGDRFELRELLKGANGKEAMVLTGWINDGKGNIRLTTLHIDDIRSGEK